MENIVPPGGIAELFHSLAVIGYTVTRSTRAAASKLVHEHPYFLLFILIHGILLWPMSATLVIGTFMLAFSAVVTAIGAIIIFAPMLVLLTFTALIGWAGAVAAVAGYRYIWKGSSWRAQDQANRNRRWRLYASTLENDVRTVNLDDESPVPQSEAAKRKRVVHVDPVEDHLYTVAQSQRTSSVPDINRPGTIVESEFYPTQPEPQTQPEIEPAPQPIEPETESQTETEQPQPEPDQLPIYVPRHS